VARSSRKYFSRIWLHPRYESRGEKRKRKNFNRFHILLWLPPETYHQNLAIQKKNLQNLANLGFSFSFSFFSHEKFFVWVKIIFFSCRNLATIRQ
jgi:hypothetical protein